MAQLISLSHTQTNRFITHLEGAQAYATLKEIVSKKGILKRDYSYYTLLITFVFSGFLLSGYMLFILTDPLRLILWSFIFAFFSVQFGGLMHDAGHRAICTSVRMNDFWGIIFGTMVAMGFSDWKKQHNMHHAHPNQEDEDPDIELPILSLTKERYQSKKGLARSLAKYQAYLYFPLGSLVSYSKRIYTFKYFKNHFKKAELSEFLLFTVSFLIWFFVPFLIFDFYKASILFLSINMAMGIYLLNIFAPNHKGMPQLAKEQKISFVEQQIMTSRNVEGNWFNDFFYMGLNYQIEHHLFPNCPRNKLHLLTPYVKAMCKKLRLEYTVVDPIESNRIILSQLHSIPATVEK